MKWTCHYLIWAKFSTSKQSYYSQTFGHVFITIFFNELRGLLNELLITYHEHEQNAKTAFFERTVVKSVGRIVRRIQRKNTVTM